MNRRNLMKMIPPGLLLPGQILSDFSWEHGFFNESLRSSSQQQKIAELFKKAIIMPNKENRYTATPHRFVVSASRL